MFELHSRLLKLLHEAQEPRGQKTTNELIPAEIKHTQEKNDVKMGKCFYLYRCYKNIDENTVHTFLHGEYHSYLIIQLD